MLSKADVINAAAFIADKDGFENLSLAAVASALKIRVPSLYNHVEGLPGLRRDLVTLGLRDLAAELGRAGVGRERDSAVRAIASAYRAYARRRPGLYAATLHASISEHQAASSEVLDIVVAVLSGYNLGPDGTLHAVRGIRSALHGFLALEALGQFGMPLDIDTSFDLLIDTIIRGLKEANSTTAAT